MKLSRYCIIYPDLTDHDSVILYSTKRASAVKVDKSTLDDINNGSISDEDKLTLTDLGFIVSSDEAEKAEMMNFFDELNAMDTRLPVIIAMNLDCNLACPYCFEGSRRGKHYMSEQTAAEVIRFINNRLNGIEELRVSFYGGEPLLSKALVLDMSKRLHGICGEKGIKFTTSMTTNGTLLTPAIAEQLKPYGLVSAFITIDGPEHIHNVSRPFATGKGSFETIVKNIKAVCELINIEVSGNFSRENHRQFPLLLDQLIQHGITPDKVSSVKFDPVLRERDGIVSPDYNGGCRYISLLRDGSMAGLDCRKPYYDACLEALVKQDLAKAG